MVVSKRQRLGQTQWHSETLKYTLAKNWCVLRVALAHVPAVFRVRI